MIAAIQLAASFADVAIVLILTGLVTTRNRADLARIVQALRWRSAHHPESICAGSGKFLSDKPVVHAIVATPHHDGEIEMSERWHQRVGALVERRTDAARKLEGTLR